MGGISSRSMTSRPCEGRRVRLRRLLRPRPAGQSTSTIVQAVTEHVRRASEWIIHGERVVDDTRRAVLSIAEVELPDGVRFEQYVLRVPSAAIVVVLDEADHVLMMWRHRFIVGRWVWELPGGYLDPDEDPAACAAREVEEETGWRPRSMQPLLTFQPMVGTIDQPNIVYLARGADPTGAAPDINETERVGWIPLSEAQQRINAGEIVGAGSVAGLFAVLLAEASDQL
jgi:8-oxo-dGTP pyrophosphatase MutT (NUDIX family)